MSNVLDCTDIKSYVYRVLRVLSLAGVKVVFFYFWRVFLK